MNLTISHVGSINVSPIAVLIAVLILIVFTRPRMSRR